MTSTVSISWGMIVLGLLACAAAGVAMFFALAAMLGKLFSKPVVGFKRSHFRLAMTVFAVTAIVAIVATRGTRARTITIEGDVHEIVSIHDSMSELSQIRQDAQESVNDVKIAISDIKAALKDSAEVVVVSAQQSEAPPTAPAQEPQPESSPQPPAQPEPPKAEPATPETAAATSNTTAAQTESPTSSTETAAEPETKKDNVADFIRSLLSHGTTAVRPDAAPATHPDGQNAVKQDGMMLLTMTPEDATAMFAGPDMLSKLNAQLPEGVKVAYALVPLTAPVDSAVAPVKPLLAAGSLQTLANQMVTLLEPFRTASSNESTTKPSDLVLSTTDNTNGVIILTEPAWLKKPDGGRITVQSRPIFDGDDRNEALNEAISKAYQQHAAEHFQTLDPALVSMVQRLELKLDDATAKLCLAEKPFQRREQAKFGQDEKPFEIVYALVQFPESVDKAAESRIRHAIQQDRLLALGLAVGFGWIGVMSIGGSIRMWTRRTGLKRFACVPFAGLATVMIVGTIAVIAAASQGDGPHVSSSLEEPLVISVDVPDKA